MNEHTRKTIRFFSNSTLLIGVATLIGYFLAYHYQKGYLSFYKLDEVYVDTLSINNVIVTFVAMISFIIILLPISVLLKDLLTPKDKEHKIVTWFFIKYGLIIPILIGYGTSIFFRFKLINSLLFSGTYLFVFTFLLIVSFFSINFSNGQTYKQRIKELIIKNSPAAINTVYEGFKRETIDFLIAFIALILALSTLAHFMGFNSALNKTEYQVITYEKETHIVVSRFSNNNLIVSPYEKESNVISASYKIVEVKSAINDSMVLKYIELEAPPKVEIID